MVPRLVRQLQAWLEMTDSALAAVNPTPGLILDGPAILDARQRKLVINLLRDHRAAIARELSVTEPRP